MRTARPARLLILRRRSQVQILPRYQTNNKKARYGPYLFRDKRPTWHLISGIFKTYGYTNGHIADGFYRWHQAVSCVPHGLVKQDLESGP